MSDADAAQARVLMGALREQERRLSRKLARAERERARGTRPAGDAAALRDLSHARFLIQRLHRRYPVVGEALRAEAHTSFQDLLNRAITQGLMPAHGADLGADTWAAIDRVAREHPEATPELIASAHDAFVREHGPDRLDL
jgi:hypothetical protein